MNKKIIAMLITTVMCMCLCAGCGNKDLFDTNYTYNRAIIQLQNGEIVEGKVDNWTDYTDGDQIQVQIDGTVYLVHSSNVDLIHEK